MRTQQYSSNVPTSIENYRPVPFSETERRSFLRAGLGLFLKRLNLNLRVSRQDLARLARYADTSRP